MKLPINWHKECLSNRYFSIKSKEERMNILKKELEREIADFDFYSSQILEAEKKGIESFDSDRFMHKRNKK